MSEGDRSVTDDKNVSYLALNTFIDNVSEFLNHKEGSQLPMSLRSSPAALGLDEFLHFACYQWKSNKCISLCPFLNLSQI